MGFEAKVILDSVAPSGVRLTTIAATFPRFILAEMNTHRVFSRNTESSRAIPVEKRIQRVRDDPFVPEFWGANDSGMTAQAEVDARAQEKSRDAWTAAKENAVRTAAQLAEYGVHKQLANRLLEPFSWTTQLISATEWDNFFKLRCSFEAQPEIQKIAKMIRQARDESVPQKTREGWWHLPFISEDEAAFWLSKRVGSDFEGRLASIKCVSIARCARVSYLTHEGVRDYSKDLDLYVRLSMSGHWSPFEHVATPMLHESKNFSGNYKGWVQWRKMFEGESGTCKETTK